MNNQLTAVEKFRQALMEPTRGVIGLVDDLLNAPWEHSVRLNWRGERCCVQLGNDPRDLLELPVAKSVIRAALARIAVLCNQYKANSVSPFGGQGELLVGNDLQTTLHVAFTNTPDEQSAEIVRAPGVSSVDRNGISTNHETRH
jgi:hypothetical protein